MSKRKDKLLAQVETTTQKIDRFVGEIAPPDLLILAGGFVAGTQGWTPLSAILKVAPEFNISKKLESLKETAKQKLPPEKANAVNMMADSMGLASFFNPIAIPVVSWGSGEMERQLETLPDYQESTKEEKEAMKEYFMATLCMGIVGMVEAYVITRPGSIAGIGEIIKGIGEIIPG